MADEKKETVKKTNTTKKNTSASSKKTSNTSKKKSTSTNATTKKTSTVSKPKTTTTKKTTTAKPKTSTKKSTTVKKENKAATEVKPIKVEVKEEVVTPVVVKPKNVETETCSILGTPLPTGTDKVDIDTRNKLYMKDALIFSFVIPVIDLFAMLFIKSYKPYPITNTLGINYLITLLIDFILIFILTFSVDFIHGERTVRKVNNKK